MKVMQAENETNKKETKKEAKKEAKKPENRSVFSKFIKHLKDLRAEFHKVVWPGRKELVAKTVTVMITSAIIGGIIVGLDTVFGFGLGIFTEFVVG